MLFIFPIGVTEIKLLSVVQGNKMPLTHCKNDTGSISYVTGQRGSRKIQCGGFSYICAKITGDRKYWVCAKQRSRNCKARLITNVDESVVVPRNQIHNHGSEHGKEQEHI